MFKKKKKVVYKSQNNKYLLKDLSAKLVALIICAFSVAVCISLFLLFPYSGISLPSFYLTKYLWLAIFFIVLVLSCSSLMLVTNQGANKKVFLYFCICASLLLLVLIVGHICKLFYVALFISAFLLYYALLLWHELKKTNKIAYYFFISFVLFTTFNVLIYYFIAVMN